jgi:ubiquinone/menaquinone biosynthesis C-methylase UbiE
MSRQDYYKEKYRQLKPDWQDCLQRYISTVDSLVYSNSKILDIGCGHGDFMKPVYQKTDFTFGIDPDKRSLDKNQIIKNKFSGTVESLPFPDNFFDLAVSAFVLEHLENPTKAFKEIYRVLKPGGKAIFLTPNVWNYNVWIIRLIPEKFHDFLTRKLYNRQEHDAFSKFYRINSVKKIRHTLAPLGFKEIDLLLNGDPTYISFNNILFKFSCFLESILDRWFKSAKVHLIGVYEKKKEFAAKEKLEIVNFRGGAAHFCPAVSEPRKARRGNSVRAILRIHR